MLNRYVALRLGDHYHLEGYIPLDGWENIATSSPEEVAHLLGQSPKVPINKSRDLDDFIDYLGVQMLDADDPDDHPVARFRELLMQELHNGS